jgi:hypothetical protein
MRGEGVRRIHTGFTRDRKGVKLSCLVYLVQSSGPYILGRKSDEIIVEKSKKNI